MSEDLSQPNVLPYVKTTTTGAAEGSESKFNDLLVDEWSDEFPDKEGTYWFYGYRYGKISCGRETKPELMLVKANKISNGVCVTADGQFMFERELEQQHFKKVELPELPVLDN